MQLDEHFRYCPPLDSLMKTRQVTLRSGEVRKIAGVSSPNNLVTLRNLFLDLKPIRTLEVGLAFGGSALVFTSSHRESGRPPGRQHTAIDPFQTQAWNQAGLVTIERADLREFLDFRELLSSAALPQLVAEGARYELIYIDGSHIFEDVFIDFYYSTRLLAEGGVVAFDDCADPHVRKVIKFIRSNFGGILEPLDLSEYRADQGASLKYRVGKLMGKTQMVAFRRIGPPDRAWNAPFTDF